MNVTMKSHARCTSSGLQALLNSSFASIDMMDADEEDSSNHHHLRFLRGDVYDILDEVEAVLNADSDSLFSSSSSDLPFVEPTPIAPDRSQIVDQVQVTENPWHVDCDAFLHVLHPLLSKRKQEEQDSPQDIRRPFKKSRTTKQPQSSVAASGSMESLNSTTSHSSDSSTSGGGSNSRFRSYQAEQWSERYEDLVAFHDEFGHVLVPHKLPTNPALAQWTKRQRYQHKLLMAGKHSTLTSERVSMLEALGFVWDSHRAAWEERLDELLLFKAKHGHTNVPANFKGNPTLAIWIKCQRRQHRLFLRGEPCNMSDERINKLDALGFVWNPRKGTE